jgi:hypothetical protein
VAEKMKAFFFPVVVSLVVQATGSLGGAFYCRALEARLAACCCPSDEEAAPGPALGTAACCDVLQATAGAADAREDGTTPSRAPARTTPAVDVAPPADPALAPASALSELARRESGRPPGRSPLFIAQRALLI